MIFFELRAFGRFKFKKLQIMIFFISLCFYELWESGHFEFGKLQILLFFELKASRQFQAKTLYALVISSIWGHWDHLYPKMLKKTTRWIKIVRHIC